MFSIPEQFSSATKTNLEAQFALFSSLAGKAFEGIEKIVELNLTAAKATLEESTAAAQQLLSAKDPQEFFSLSAAQAQPSAEKAIAYGRHLAAITSSTQAEFSKAAEAQIAETNRKVISLVEEVTKNAPAGSENAVAILKSAIGNANAGYEQFSKTSKQAAETIEANLASAVNQFTQAAEKAVPRTTAK
ncbi:TIGR01841 family phasin [Janthinobacterium sp. HLX7-2]|uniref:TIGR01841 family phasin n=1 Tax=Janthinobacterium sp. HLX7-2 TaxID=1259331 RepID=UPI003F286622